MSPRHRPTCAWSPSWISRRIAKRLARARERILEFFESQETGAGAAQGDRDARVALREDVAAMSKAAPGGKGAGGSDGDSNPTPTLTGSEVADLNRLAILPRHERDVERCPCVLANRSGTLMKRLHRCPALAAALPLGCHRI